MRHVRPLRRKRRSFELISIFFQSVYSLRPLFGHVRLNFSAHVSQSYLFFSKSGHYSFIKKIVNTTPMHNHAREEPS